MSDPTHSHPTLRIEELFVDLLRAYPGLAGLEIVPASNREVTVPPTHIFVLCESAHPITSTGPLHRAQVRVVLVTNVDDVDHETRKAYADTVRMALRQAVPTPAVDADATLCGYTVTGQDEDSDEQQTGDVFRIVCGAEIAVG